VTLETVNIDAVPILAAGGPYFGAGSGPAGDCFSVADLERVASANEALRDELKVPLKIGHSASQRLLRNSGLFGDEMPAAGWLENFRVAGGKLLVDLKRVPKKLAETIKVGAFPHRSAEVCSVQSQRTQRLYDSVVTGLALLGARGPAIRTLDDVLALYSQGEPTRIVVGLDGRPLTLPASTADAMEAALKGTPGLVSEEGYAAYFTACFPGQRRYQT
jgi:hypothetical protein